MISWMFMLTWNNISFDICIWKCSYSGLNKINLQLNLSLKKSSKVFLANMITIRFRPFLACYTVLLLNIKRINLETLFKLAR